MFIQLNSLVKSSLFLVLLGSEYGLLWGEEYKPPSSPELYDSSKTLELQKSIESSAGIYGGALLGIGQGRSASFNPITAYNGGGDFGYRKAVNSWTFWEAGIELFFGKGGHSQAEMSIYWGSLIKLGYGYSIANGVYSILSFGAGLAKASYSGNDEKGQELKSTKDPLGSIFFASYSFEFSTSLLMNPSIGIRWSFYNFNLEKVVNSVKSVVDIDREVYFHSPQVFIGLRF